MIERFTEPHRAVAYLCSAMDDSLVDSKVDVTLFPAGSRPPESRTVDDQFLLAVLDRLSERFVEATAIYGLETDGFPIGAIQCRCSTHYRATCAAHCRHHDDRPIICVMGFRGGQPPAGDQRKKAAAALRREIRRLKETGENHVKRVYRG